MFMWCLKQAMIIVFLTGAVSIGSAASVVVAPASASAKEKARADYVCNGKDDQVELLASIQAAKKYPVLVGYKEHKGTGLYIDSSVENVCTNRFEGTDIAHFHTGIFVGAANKDIKESGHGKTDTNWFWCSYICPVG